MSLIILFSQPLPIRNVQNMERFSEVHSWFLVLSRKLALLLTLTTKRKICQVHSHTPKPFGNKQETVL